MLRKLEKPEQALTSFEKAIERARAKYDRLAVINHSMPDLTPEEREMFLKWAAKKRDRSIRRADIRRGIVLRDLDRLDEAVSAYDKAIKLEPESGYTYVERGWAYEKQGRLKEALANYERATQLDYTSDWLTKALPRIRSKVQ